MFLLARYITDIFQSTAFKTRCFFREEIRDLISIRLQQGKCIDKPIVEMELWKLNYNMRGEMMEVGLLKMPDLRIWFIA